MNKVTVFLPCREGSQRIKNKNIKPFADCKEGLIHIKLSQLVNIEVVDTIIVSTNDDKVKEIARSFKNSKIVIDNRAEELSSSDTSTDDLIKYVPRLIKEGAVLWTHVTSPFVNEKIYTNAINDYFKNIHIYDSSMSVTKIQKFLWDDNKAINYDKAVEKWPRTQTLKPIYEINSGFFLADIEIYKNYDDRVGIKPNLYKIDDKEAFDIDWEIDFEIAEVLWKKESILVDK